MATLQQQTADERHWPARIRVVDSHTEGEPTRVVIDGWPPLRARTMSERRDELAAHWDHLRGAVVCEPRGHDAMVGALLTPPVSDDAAAGVIFFNNTGYLGMCGHGMMGVVRTLAYLGRVSGGSVRIDTPAGTVTAQLAADGITIGNVPARVHATDVTVAVTGVGPVTGDIAYGGNWFFLTSLPAPPLELPHVAELLRITRAILHALHAAGIRGEAGAGIDHVELTGPARSPGADARNFVLCPGGAYDRSPCGTGTSAKLAVLHARGQLEPGRRWRQESITGGRFTAWLEVRDGELHPFLRGQAWLTAESVLRLDDPSDPFRAGFTAVGAR